MRAVLLATAMMLPMAAFAHTRTRDPVALADPVPVVPPPHQYVTCAGQDATAELNADVAVPGSITTLSAGVCLVSAPVTMASGTVLNGLGASVSILRAAVGGAFDVIDIGSVISSHVVTGAQVRFLTIDGNATAGSPPGVDANGVKVWSSSTAINLQDIEVLNAADNGVRIAGSSVELNHSYIHDNQHNGVFVQGVTQPGLPVHWADGDMILDSRVSSNSLAAPPPPTGPATTWDGIDIDQTTSNALVQGNIVVGNDIILHESFTGQYAMGHRVLDNTIQDSLEAGIDVAGQQTGFLVSGNTLIRCWTMSIVVGGAATGIVSGNTAIGGGPFVFRIGTNVTEDSNVAQ